MRTSECARTCPVLSENIPFLYCEHRHVSVSVCTCPCRSGCPDPMWLSQWEESSDCDQYQWTGCYSGLLRGRKKRVKILNITEMIWEAKQTSSFTPQHSWFSMSTVCTKVFSITLTDLSARGKVGRSSNGNNMMSQSSHANKNDNSLNSAHLRGSCCTVNQKHPLHTITLPRGHAK